MYGKNTIRPKFPPLVAVLDGFITIKLYDIAKIGWILYKNRWKSLFARLSKNGSSYLCIVQFILYAILIYIAYQFIFKLVIPIFLTTRKIKKGFRDMQSKMQEQMKQQQGGFEGQASTSTAPKKEAGKLKHDYIDFEEVK